MYKYNPTANAISLFLTVFLIVFISIFPFIPLDAKAFVNNTVPPKITQTEISISFDSTDVANCEASDPSFDRITIDRILQSFGGEVFTDLLFTSIPATISTTTEPSYYYLVYCSNSAHDRNFGSDIAIYNVGYLDNSFSFPDEQIAYQFVSQSTTTSNSTTTTTIINDPNRDYFYGVFLFFLLCGGLLFTFKLKI